MYSFVDLDRSQNFQKEYKGTLTDFFVEIVLMKIFHQTN